MLQMDEVERDFEDDPGEDVETEDPEGPEDPSGGPC